MSYAVEVEASVQMQGLSADEWTANHTTAFEAGVESVMEDSNPGTTATCTVNSVTDVDTTSRRRAATDSVEVDFTVVSTGNSGTDSADDEADAITQSLEDSVADGSFETSVQSEFDADESIDTTLTVDTSSIEATGAAMEDSSDSSDDDDDDDDGKSYTGIVVGVIVGFIVVAIILMVAFKCLSQNDDDKKEAANANNAVEETANEPADDDLL